MVKKNGGQKAGNIFGGTAVPREVAPHDAGGKAQYRLASLREPPGLLGSKDALHGCKQASKCAADHRPDQVFFNCRRHQEHCMVYLAPQPRPSFKAGTLPLITLTAKRLTRHLFWF